MATTFDPGKSGVRFARIDAARVAHDPAAAFALLSHEVETGAAAPLRRTVQRKALEAELVRSLCLILLVFFLLLCGLLVSFSLGREMGLYGIVRMS